MTWRFSAEVRVQRNVPCIIEAGATLFTQVVSVVKGWLYGWVSNQRIEIHYKASYMSTKESQMLKTNDANSWVQKSENLRQQQVRTERLGVYLQMVEDGQRFYCYDKAIRRYSCTLTLVASTLKVRFNGNYCTTDKKRHNQCRYGFRCTNGVIEVRTGYSQSKWKSRSIKPGSITIRIACSCRCPQKCSRCTTHADSWLRE